MSRAPKYIVIRIVSATAAALLFLAGIGPAMAADGCTPEGYSRQEFLDLKQSGFEVPDEAVRNELAVGLMACLSDPDPRIRDGVAFEAVSGWLRGQALSTETQRALYEVLVAQLTGEPDASGFRQPFAALLLSEVARTDRVEAWMTPALRERLVAVAAAYLEGVDDYRGFSESEGWRHGVAHGSDLVLQLVLNPNVDAAQIERLMTALRTQVAPGGEVFYVYGEPGRLARAVYYAYSRGAAPDSFWIEWMGRGSDPGPLGDWSSAFASQAGLARRHNTMAFLLALHFNSTLSGEEQDARLGEWVKAAILKVWS